jgi:hypothetical protein
MIERKAIEYCRGNWTQIVHPLYAYLQSYRKEFPDDYEPDLEAIGFTKSARLIEREGITVDLLARGGHEKQPYLVRTIVVGKTEEVYAADFQSVLGLLKEISEAFGTGA